MPPNQSKPILTGERGERADGVGTGPRSHDRGELSWLSIGTQRVVTAAGVWVMPAAFALWLPSRASHDVNKTGAGAFHWVKFAAEVSARLPRQACAVQMTAGLRSAVERATDGSPLAPSEIETLVDVFVREIVDAALTPILLPTAVPAALLPIITRLLEEPSDERSLEEWAVALQVSSSTITRTFQRELGLSFREYRHRVRLLSALERLAAGDDVSQVARKLGYRSVSMFVELFRKKLGVTPGRYFNVTSGREPASGRRVRQSPASQTSEHRSRIRSGASDR